jgi:von Willebrand factor type A domain/Aerotolerance regulator N-terminal
MFLLNLAWLQWMAIFGGVAAGVLVLYLRERSRRHLTVPTLRFWIPGEKGVDIKRRRKIREPLSLLLQLLAIALLLLAAAEPRLGKARSGRDHVLVLDTSAWMAARATKGTLMDEARAAAKAYVRSMPAGDRLMLVRADALATPATTFESNRQAIEQSIDESQPGATALRLHQAFTFAQEAQQMQSGRRGEVIYVGAGRIHDDPADLARNAVPSLRVLSVPDAVETCGLKDIGLRRSASDPDEWEILVKVHNYGASEQSVTVTLGLEGSSVGAKRMKLAPGADENYNLRYRTRSAGWLEARVLPAGAFSGNSSARILLPARIPLRVAVYSDDPAPLKPILTANAGVEAVFHTTAEYPVKADEDFVILDRFNPPTPPSVDSIWIEPPSDRSPVRLRFAAASAPLTRWRPDHPLAAGLRARNLPLVASRVYQPAPDDIVIAESEAGPVMVARSGRPKTVVLGFDPVRTPMRFQLATPLLFANIMRWMAPGAFRRWELGAGMAGAVNIALEPGAEEAGVNVLDENGSAMPFTVEDRRLRFFVGAPGSVRISTGKRELIYSLALPEVSDTKWTPPANARRGIPFAGAVRGAYADIWQWLLLAGALALVTEWILFGKARISGGRAQ